MVQVLVRVKAWSGIKRVVLTPPALQNTSKALPIPGILPTLKRTTVNVRAESEHTISRKTNPETIIVRDRRAHADACRGIARVPQLEQGALRVD